MCVWDGMENFIPCDAKPGPAAAAVSFAWSLPILHRFSDYLSTEVVLSPSGRFRESIGRERASRVARVPRVPTQPVPRHSKKEKKNSNFLSRRSHIMISQSVPFGTEGAAPIPTAGRQSQCHLEHFSQVGRSHLKSGCGRRERQAQAADWPHYPAPSRSLPRKRGEREWGGERGGVRWKCERRDACPTRPGLVPFFVLF